MLIPKFSIRQMLLAMIGIGVLSACLGGAWRGNNVAVGLSVAIVGLIIPFVAFLVVHWSAFAIAHLPAIIFGGVQQEIGEPPQIRELDSKPDSNSDENEKASQQDA